MSKSYCTTCAAKVSELLSFCGSCGTRNKRFNEGAWWEQMYTGEVTSCGDDGSSHDEQRERGNKFCVDCAAQLGTPYDPALMPYGKKGSE